MTMDVLVLDKTFGINGDSLPNEDRYIDKIQPRLAAVAIAALSPALGASQVAVCSCVIEPGEGGN